LVWRRRKVPRRRLRNFCTTSMIECGECYGRKKGLKSQGSFSCSISEHCYISPISLCLWVNIHPKQFLYISSVPIHALLLIPPIADCSHPSQFHSLQREPSPSPEPEPTRPTAPTHSNTRDSLFTQPTFAPYTDEPERERHEEPPEPAVLLQTQRLLMDGLYSAFSAWNLLTYSLQNKTII